MKQNTLHLNIVEVIFNKITIRNNKNNENYTFTFKRHSLP